MRRLLSVLAACGLAACAAGPVAPPKPDVRTPVVEPGGGGSALEARRTVRTFVQTIEAVEPVAEAVCREQAPRLNCDFRIVVDDTINAAPNAFQRLDETGRPVIAITVSLIAEARNRDELAFILAHEAAHHIEGHLAEQRRNAAIGASILGNLAALGNDPETVRAAAEVGAVLGARTYSKEFELEADALGTVIAARAGFNPLRGAEFFFRIPDPGDRFLGTHPANADRLSVVQQTAAQLGF